MRSTILNFTMMFKSVTLTSKLCRNIFKNPTLAVVSCRKMSSDANDVIIEEKGDKGVLTLNRPKALNALNMSMVNKILPILKKWENEKTIVIVKGNGDKAFCAGGDVRAIVESNMRGEHLGREFFRKEYTMNGIIGTYPIPYVALIDGITMGGGVGLSVHGRYRVATERTLFAMPETQIGLFPDVGGSYVLPRLGGKLGWYLALTGYRLKGLDVLKAGIATHYVDSKSILDLEKEILTCNNDNDVQVAIKKFSAKDEREFTLAPYLKQIDKCFTATSVEDIVQNLKEDNSKWAQETLNTLALMSPTSMKVSKLLLDRGQNLNLLECLQLEYRVAYHTLNNKEFSEGVRALLIDKDKNPKWNPATLEQVTDKMVEDHFKLLPEEEELKHKL